tara:strand:+ start:168741 stop:169256 length:516 start_codon:yes stop_codon:yes gene_type:complete
MDFKNLDDTTRKLMEQEIQSDIDSDSYYKSKLLTPSGLANWPSLLLDAAAHGTDQTLASAIANFFVPMETYVRNGKTHTRKVASNANERLAEGEFNAYYIRALCLRSMGEGNDTVKVYRAKQVSHARSESEMKIGTNVEASALLQDLRSNIGFDSALGIPAGPNSGLSVKL